MTSLWKSKSGRAHHCSPLNGLPSVWLELLFEPRDLWFGIHWKRADKIGWKHHVDIYVCVVPMLPLKIMLRWAGWKSWWHDILRWAHERAETVDEVWS